MFYANNIYNNLLILVLMNIEKININQEIWDKIAFSFDITRRKPWNQCINFINSLSKDSIVADIGCGNGRHLIPCAKKCKKAIGIDISKELVRIIKTKNKLLNLKNIELVHSDAINLPIKDNSFDAIIFIASLHNIKDKINRIKSLNELNRVLKNDKKALISVWSRWQDKFRKDFLKKWFTEFNKNEFGDIDIYWKQHGLNIPRFYHLYSKREFIKDLKKADFNIIRFEEVKLHSKNHPDNFFAEVKKK